MLYNFFKIEIRHNTNCCSLQQLSRLLFEVIKCGKEDIKTNKDKICGQKIALLPTFTLELSIIIITSHPTHVKVVYCIHCI